MSNVENIVEGFQITLAGYPNRNNSNRKIEGARGTMGRGKRRELSLFPLPIVSRALSFPFSPASLRHKEASVEGGVESSFKYVSHYFVSLITEKW